MIKNQTKNLILKILVIILIAVSFAFSLKVFLNSKYYKDEYNPQGGMHPRLEKSEDLGDWIIKHCDAETVEIAPYIMWYAEYNGIKKEVPFAISWADSRCGQDLTTRYNYGNVGNTDGGARRGFANAFDGWMAIVDTLNNRHLSGLEKIGHFSQGGRNNMVVQYSCHGAPSPFKCYATSEYNWNKNVTRALTVMTGQEATEEYLVRNIL